MFQFSQLAAATNNFSPQNEIGRGGFGAVYKGQMHDGLEVAIKRCFASGSDTDLDKQLQEFQTEVELLKKLHHKNIVELLGYCTEQGERILVYEYIVNGSMDKYIYGMGRGLILGWSTRIRIIKGIAQGIIYLHEKCGAPIVHGDIKSNNILLDSNLNPKITDFATARVITPGAEVERTDTLRGTIGYFTLEYLTERIYSIKSDVYSFGVVLIEIIAGKRRVLFPREGHSTYIHEYARELWTEGRSIELIDPRLPSEAHINEILRCIQIGLLCVEKNRCDRPSLSDVLLMITSESTSLRAPSTEHSSGENLSHDCEAVTTPSGIEI